MASNDSWLQGLSLASQLGKGLLSGYQMGSDIMDRKAKRDQDAEALALDKKVKQAQMVRDGVMEDETGNFVLTPDAIKKRNVDLGYKSAESKNKFGQIINPDGSLTPVKNWESPEEKYYKRADYLENNRLKREEEKRQREEADLNDPKKRYLKQPAEVRQKIGFISSALENLTNYENVFKKGDRQKYLNPDTPLLGRFKSSSPIDDARVNLSEAIGRLASGGAIGEKELETFKKMIPTAADSDKAAVRKLIQLRSEMKNKLTAYGFKPEELEALGFDAVKLGETDELNKISQRGLLSTNQPDKINNKSGLLGEVADKSNESIGNKVDEKSKPELVSQNGQIFKLNKVTGEYEPVLSN